MRKVVLINVGNDYPRDQGGAVVSSPLSILALGSYLAAHDVPVELIDVQMDFGFGLTPAAERTVCQRAGRYLQAQAGAIAWVGISQLSNATLGFALGQEVHTLLPETPIIFGGYFPSSNYRLLLQKYPFITAIVRGDGEAAALQISHSLDQGRSFLDDRTPNLAWLSGGEIQTTPVQPMALDELPILDYGLLHNRSCYPIINMMTSRGCPFHCNYCPESKMRPYATYPAAWVARQLDHLEAQVPNTRVSIADPIFGVSRKRTLEMCQVMRGRRFAYGMESRVDVLAPDLIPPLRQAGLELVFWGIESANPATLLHMNKVRSEAKAKRYLQGALRVLKACFENEVTPFLSFMVNFPGDSEAGLQATLEFVKEAGQLHDQVAAETGVKTGLVPFPHPTKIYEGCQLAERVTTDFPDAVLYSDPFDGERTVLSASPGLDRGVARRYEIEIASQGRYTPQVLELIDHYLLFSAKDFVAKHPELTDEQGITTLHDSLQRLSDPEQAGPSCYD